MANTERAVSLSSVCVRKYSRSRSNTVDFASVGFSGLEFSAAVL